MLAEVNDHRPGQLEPPTPLARLLAALPTVLEMAHWGAVVRYDGKNYERLDQILAKVLECRAARDELAGRPVVSSTAR